MWTGFPFNCVNVRNSQIYEMWGQKGIFSENNAMHYIKKIHKKTCKGWQYLIWGRNIPLRVKPKHFKMI